MGLLYDLPHIFWLLIQHQPFHNPTLTLSLFQSNHPQDGLLVVLLLIHLEIRMTTPNVPRLNTILFYFFFHMDLLVIPSQHFLLPWHPGPSWSYPDVFHIFNLVLWTCRHIQLVSSHESCITSLVTRCILGPRSDFLVLLYHLPFTCVS